MHPLLTKNGRVMASIGAFCIILIALIWARLYCQLQHDRSETIEAAVQRNANLAVALEQYAIRTIQNGDAVLQLIKKEYETVGNRIQFRNLLNIYTTDKNFFTGVSITDEKGNVVVANFSILSDTVVNVKDRKHFQYHLLHHDGGLFIGEPIQSRTLKKATIPLSRRWNNPDGSFGGTVTLQIEPATLTRFYAEANLRTHDIISLMAPDGITYSRRTGPIDSYGEDISKSPLYKHLKKAPVNNYFAADALHGIPTFFSYRQLKQYPMIATVGVSAEDVLAGYYKRARNDYVSTAVISLLIILFSVLVCSVLQNRKKNLDRVKESEVKYRSVFENSSDAILLMTPGGAIVAANASACSFFGLTRDQLHTCPSTEAADGTHLNFNRLVREGGLNSKAQGELQFIRSDGSCRVGEMASADYQDAGGETHCIVIIRDSTERIRLQKELADGQKHHQRKVTEQVIQAQEREREIIGRELHDNVNQVLTTVKLYLEMAISNKEAREELLPKSMQYITESINEIRKLSRDLSAPTLGTKSLVDSVTALIETVQSSGKLRIHFEHGTFADHLTIDQTLAIYRIVQEQLNNIIKHARATAVVVTLAQTKSGTTLSIRDNGQGFDPLAQRNGIGLNNIVSRAKVFDGDVSITSEKGKGCLLEVNLPATHKEVQHKMAGQTL